MKNRLICQSSDYDCGPTTLTNALRFLFERAEIRPALLKQIWAMGNDTFSKNGLPGGEGTSKEALRYLAHWFTHYGERTAFPLRARFLDGEDAVIRPGGEIWNCLQDGGCVMMRCWHGGDGHYVLLTRILNEDEIGLFDPYDECPDPGDPARRFVPDRPKEMNRAVRWALMNQSEGDYAMGDPERREILLLWRCDRAAATAGN